MGNCVCTKVTHLSTEYMQQIRCILSEGQIYILHLMYVDLADRIVDHKINLQNFLLFFHKNGFWGQRLFKQFDYDGAQLISEQEFIRGIAQIFKSTDKEKISLLFKFFSKGEQDQKEGVDFQDFLIMLYNYPKDDLKEILNDKSFIQLQLKKHLVPAKPEKEGDTGNVAYQFATSESGFRLKQYLMKVPNQRNKQEIPSIIGKKMIEQLKKQRKVQDKVIRLKDGDQYIDIKTINIQQIVKRFALSIFKNAKINVKTGRLNFSKFYQWISIHKALFQNYYEGFHNQVWQTDLRTKKPKYLLSKSQKISDAKTFIKDSSVKVKIILLHSILMITQQNNMQQPLMTICLQGLAVRRIFESSLGFGVQISHRDGVYPQKKIFFKNQQLLHQWMQLFRFYKGESIQKRYEFGQKIGTGKFSVVYRAISYEDGKQYALKQIATFKLQPQAKNLIAHESSIMQIVSHPLLLEFKECIQTKTHIYIITELVKGKDLFQFVKDYDFLEEYDAAKICQQIIVGIRYLHSLQIVHRDLKPQNIMVVLDEKQEVIKIKIIDFGFSNYLSKLREIKQEAQLMAGTPNYIAPEVLRQEKFTFKVDNFAIGVILYFMLTGALPFNDYTIAEILQNTMNGTFKFTDGNIISEEAKDLIQFFLKNDPSQRISLEDALKHEWFKILNSPRKKQRKPIISSNKKKYHFLS